MKVYHVSGVISVVAISEEAACAALADKARSAEMDLDGLETSPNTRDEFARGYVATALVAGFFRAASAQEADARFRDLILSRCQLMPQWVATSESVNVPEEWVR